MNKFSFITLALVAGVGCAVACSSSSDDSTSSPNGGAGGKAGATGSTGGTGGTGGKASGGSGGTAGKAGASEAGMGGANEAGMGGMSEGGASEAGMGGMNEGGMGGAGGATASIYDDLGQQAGITTAVNAIVAAEVADPDIATYFSQQGNPAHSPTVADIKDCLVIQLSEATGGPQTYVGHHTTSGFACRSMAVVHADLNINSGTFNNFVTIAAGVLAAAPFNVPTKDLTVIGSVLLGQKPAIVTATPDSDTERPCTAPAACAAAAGAGGSN